MSFTRKRRPTSRCSRPATSRIIKNYALAAALVIGATRANPPSAELCVSRLKVKLVYCADGNNVFAEIAKLYNYLYGAQPLKTFYLPLEFADVDPNAIPPRDKYIAAIKKYCPEMATVRDWSIASELSDVLGWAEEIAPFVEKIIIIPKVIDGISKLPKFVGGKKVILGYSVPTTHGGTSVPIWEFAGWPVHLLGGSPQAQMMMARYLNVVSCDGNMAAKMARGQTRAGAVCVWKPDKRDKGHWQQLSKYNGYIGNDSPYVAWEISCKNIALSWAGAYAC
jgi:hypothetical protein